MSAFNSPFGGGTIDVPPSDPNYKGWYASQAIINATYPVGQTGWYVINGTTDTIWIWSAASTAWVDSSTPGSGDVRGPAVSVDENLPVFDGVTGKFIKDSGKKIIDLEPAHSKTFAARAPLATDDGFAVWSYWVDTSGANAEVYRCMDNTAGAAEWVHTSLDLDDLGNAAVKDVGTGVDDVAAGDHGHSGVYLESETDPVVGAINGLVKADGAGTISAAVPGTDYEPAFGDQVEKTFFAGPATGADAAPTFRAVLADDIPTLNQNTTGTAANVTGTVAVANGGTGQTTEQLAINALTDIVGAADEHVLTKDTATGNAVFKAGGGTWGSITGTLSDQTDLQTSLSSKKIYHGVESVGTTGSPPESILWDQTGSARTITLVGPVTYWYKGTRVYSAVDVVCNLLDVYTGGLTANNLYYISFEDTSGILIASQAMDLKEKVPVCMVFWNGTDAAVTYELHNHERDLDWHINAHLTIGTRYRGGLAVTSPTNAGNQGVLNITEGIIVDEDIHSTLLNAKMTSLSRIFYQVSAGVFTFANSTLPYAGTIGAPTFINDSYVPTTFAGGNQFACYWVYGTADIDRPIYIYPTHANAAYGSIALARAEPIPNITGVVANSLNPEMKLLYRWIYKGDGAYQEVTDYRMSSTLPAGGVAPATAGAVTYSNTTSGLTATNVQAAIDELAEDPDGHVIEDTGTPVTQRAALNFTGAVTVTDDAVNDATVVDVSGTGTVENLNIYGDYYSYSGTTGDATPLEIFVNGIPNARIEIALDSVMGFRTQVVAFDPNTGSSKSIYLTGAIKNVGGTVSLVAAVNKTIIADESTPTAFDADITADNTEKALVLKVTGVAATTVGWNARIDQTGAEESPAIGVRWAQSIDDMSRIDDARYLTRADFDNLSPWKDMRRCIMNDDGSINYYIDPDTPTEIGEVVNIAYTIGDPAVYTGADGQVMVEIPKFWYRSQKEGTEYKWWISPVAKPSYSVHPAFIRPRGGTVDVATSTVTRASGDYFRTTWVENDIITIGATNYTIHSVTSTTELVIKEDAGTLTGERYICTVGQEIDKMYFSAFEGNVLSSTMRSISGVQPSTSTNVAGTIANFRAYAKARGTGINNWNQQEFLSTCAVQLLYLIEYANFDSQTMIGRGVCDNVYGTVNHSINTGGTIALGNTSGGATGTDGLVSISYRGIENFWGNIWKFVDGLNSQNYEAFVANHDFLHDTFTDRYQSVGSVLTTNNTYVKDIVFNGTDYSFLASVGGGNSGGWLHDNWFVATGNIVPTFGGAWGSGDGSLGDRVGAFYWALANLSSDSSRTNGSRLSYIP